MSDFAYPYEEFDATLDEVHAIEGLKPNLFLGNVSLILHLFRERYPDLDEQRYKFLHFMGIMDYVTEHLPEFDQGDLAVRGREEALVGDHLMRAIHRIFTTRTPAAALRVPPAEIRDLAAEIRQAERPPG